MILLVTFFLEKKTCRPVGGVTKKFKDNPIAPRVCPARATGVLNCFQRFILLELWNKQISFKGLDLY